MSKRVVKWVVFIGIGIGARMVPVMRRQETVGSLQFAVGSLQLAVGSLQFAVGKGTIKNESIFYVGCLRTVNCKL